MEKYEKYKDSGIEWIGEIPEHWEVKKIKYISKLQGGYAFKSDLFCDDGVPIIRIGDINNPIDWDKCKKVPEKLEIPDDFVLQQFDTLIALSGATTGKTAFIGVNPEYAYINQRVAKVGFPNKLLYFNISGDNVQKLILLTADGSAQENISNSQIENLDIVIPPTPEEQTAIANYLDRKTAQIDELIADKKRLLELYEEEKTAIINQAVTKGINPDVPMKDSGIEWLGEIPEHWAISPLKYLGKFINGYSFKNTEFVSSGIRVLKISNIQNMRIDWTDESFINEDYYDTQSNFRVLKDDLVFALTRPIISTGIKVALMDIDEKILLNQRNSIYRPTEIDVKWIYYLILSANFIQEFDSRIDKTGQQPNISSNDIGNITIPVPPPQELAEIIEFINTTCTKIDIGILKVKNLIDLLIEYRTALISEVVTGKIKVTEAI